MMDRHQALLSLLALRDESGHGPLGADYTAQREPLIEAVVAAKSDYTAQEERLLALVCAETAADLVLMQQEASRAATTLHALRARHLQSQSAYASGRQFVRCAM